MPFTIEERLGDLDKRLTLLELHMHELMGQANMIRLLLAYVVSPLIAILGILVGIRLVLPGV